MTTNDMDAQALLLDQPSFALDERGFAAFQKMLDNPPATTDRLRPTLTTRAAPWNAMAVATGTSLAIEKEAEGLLHGLLVGKAEA